MKIKFVLLSSIVLIAYFMAQSFTHSLTTKNGGAPSGHSGGAYENGQTCATTGCHTGTAQYRDSLIAVIDLPADGYRSGKNYEVKVSVTESGINKFGFQASAQNASGSPIGKLTDADNNPAIQEQNLSNIYYAITHTMDGNTGSNNAKTWTMNWESPATTGQGAAFLFVAVNAANGNNQATGDLILFDTLVIEESLFNSIDLETTNDPIKIFPIPAKDHLNIETGDNFPLTQFQIFDLQGKTVMEGAPVFATKKKIDISGLKKGSYLIFLSDGESKYVKRFTKL